MSLFNSLQELLESIQEEKTTLLENVKELQESCEELQQQLQESDEKLKLLSEYPSMDSKTGTDKNYAINEREITDMDVVKDMERQVMSNNIRILTLEEQNNKLRKSITLLMSSAGDVQSKEVRALIIFI
jgi:predicted RNase H-like nuclease (RuvC/YqgF family)